REHARRSAKPHGRITYSPPPLTVDLDRAPLVIAEVDVDSVAISSNAQKDKARDAVELRIGFNERQCRRHGFAVRGATRSLVKLAPQPPTKATAPRSPRFAVAFDNNICKRGAVWRVVELNILAGGDFNEDLGLGWRLALLFRTAISLRLRL